MITIVAAAIVIIGAITILIDSVLRRRARGWKQDAFTNDGSDLVDYSDDAGQS